MGTSETRGGPAPKGCTSDPSPTARSNSKRRCPSRRTRERPSVARPDGRQLQAALARALSSWKSSSEAPRRPVHASGHRDGHAARPAAHSLQRLAELPLAAVVDETRYSALYRLEHVHGSWFADQLARLKAALPRGPPRHRRLPPLRRRLDLPLSRHSARRRIRPSPNRLSRHPVVDAAYPLSRTGEWNFDPCRDRENARADATS
jgi:hypothetical protein